MAEEHHHEGGNMMAVVLIIVVIALLIAAFLYFNPNAAEQPDGITVDVEGTLPTGDSVESGTQ